jgi:hypothetical protein
LRQQCLATAGRADKEDVGLLQLDLVVLDRCGDALVMVVDRDREDLLGTVLSDNVLVELLIDLARRRDAGERGFGPSNRLLLFLDDLPA